MAFASSHELKRDILSEFAERAAWALDGGFTLAATFERQRLKANAAVSECIARKQAAGCPKLAEARRKASAAYHAKHPGAAAARRAAFDERNPKLTALRRAAKAKQ